MTRQPNLNYDAEYQLDIPESSPISIGVPSPENIVYKDSERDYIPPDGRHLPADSPKKPQKDMKPEPRLDPEYADYVPRSVMVEREKQYRMRLKKVARQIWDDSKSDRQRYEIARQIVESATKKDIKNPSPELADAKRIMDAGPPMTTKLAVERARGILSSQSPDYNAQ